MEHKEYICTKNHADESCPISCWFCDGGLFMCSVCGGTEGGLPTECPGYKLDYEKINDIHQGKIDYRNGQWVTGVTTIHMGGKL